MNKEQSIEKYKEYLTGHIGNVGKSLEILYNLQIPFVVENIDRLREIVKEHDASKYEEPEWSAYLHHFYPTNDTEAIMGEEFENACRHHIKNNKHHWDYWIDQDNNLIEDIDEEEYKLYTIERICDWCAMAAQHDEGPTDYYNANKDYVIQPDYARELCDEIFPKIPKDFNKDMQKITRGELDESLKEDAIDDYIKSLGIDEDSVLNNYKTQISNHYKYIRQVGRKINNAKYDDERNRLKKKQDFYKEVYKRLKSLKEDLYMNRDVVDSLGKRVKKSKTSNTIEIDTQMTNHDRQLDEYGNSGYVGQSKSVRAYEAEENDIYTATECDKLLGVRSGATKACLVPSEWHHTGSYYKETDYYDIRLLLAINDNDEEIISEYTEDEIKEAKESLEELKSWRKPKLTSNTYKANVKWLTWSGTRKHPKATEHFVKNVDVEEKGSYYYFNDEYGTPTKKMIGSNGTYVYKLDESVLNEMKLSQIKQKSKNEDPERVNRSRKVKTTYLGMSKFGILNFKTTSQSRNGHHYQTIEFKDLSPFEEIIKQGKKIMPMDVKKQLQEQDVNVWCTDESWAFWAWAHQAYKNDFLYIDDRIPNLKKAIQAPKVNNVRLNGGACKHIISVIDYCTRPFVLLAISDDMNKYLEGTKEDKMANQPQETKDRSDGVANWDWEDIEKYIGMSRIEILSDISKTIQIIPSIDKADVITDLVGEALPAEQQGLKREIVDRIEELIDKEQ